MAGDYAGLRSVWAQTAQEAAKLDPVNRALVLNYLASAAQHTASVLRTHANDPASAQDAEAYASGMRNQDILRKGFSAGKQVWQALGFGSVIGVAFGAVVGLLKLFEDAGQAGSQVDLTPLITALTGSGALVYFIARAAVTAGPAAGNAIGEAWTDLLKTADPAKNLVSTKLNGPESAFFSAAGASRPSRAALNAVGPGAAVGLMAIVGIPLALAAYYFYSSLASTAEQSTTPPF